MARDGLPWRVVGGVGLLVVTSSGERRKAPLLGTYGDDVKGDVRDLRGGGEEQHDLLQENYRKL